MMTELIDFRKFVSCLTVLLIFGVQCRSQTSEPVIETPNIRPPSANASALGRYGDIPVANYTGVPSIQVPIHTLRNADLAVDISLSYHAGGVRVEDEASWVGLNWSLNAGGVITRSIRHLDDFPEFSRDFPGFQIAQGKGFFKEDAIPTYIANSAHTQGEYTWVNLWENLSSTFDNYLHGLYHGYIDGQPDIFNFNFNGHSGKFVIDKKRNSNEDYHIALLSKADLKIELVNSDLTGKQGFKITDDQGIEYWFEQLEVSRSRTSVERTGKILYDRSYITLSEIPTVNRSIILDNHPDSDFTNRISSWYLTKIVSAGGISQVSFLYETLPVYMRSLPARSQNNKSYNGYAGDELYIENYSITANETRNVYLKEISYPGTKVTFNTTDRADIMTTGDVSARKLHSIDFAYEGVVRKSVGFQYDYFDSGSGAADYVSKRLKLQSIEFYDDIGNKGGKYAFQYYDTDHLILPDKDSYSQDLFGFYNGQLSNDSKANFFPLLPTPIMSSLFPGAIGNTSIRDGDPNVVMAGLLRRLYYPTGGSSVFTYESNDYSNGEAVNYYVGNFYLLNGNGGEPLVVPPSDVVNDATLTKGAGCRIKSIVNYLADNTIDKKKVYTYGYSLGSPVSSGKLMFGMKHLRYDNLHGMFYLSSHSMYADPSSAAGSPIGYDRVQEIEYDSQGKFNGWSEFVYENEVESNASLFVLKMANPNFCSNPSGTTANHFEYTADSSTPYIIECSGWGNDIYSNQGRRDVFSPGIPNVVNPFNSDNIEHSIYDKNSVLVYRQTNIYQGFEEEKIRCIAPHRFPGGQGTDPDAGIIYNQTSLFKGLIQSTRYQDGVTTVMDYSYDPLLKHHKVQTTSNRTSKGEENKTIFRYFTDYNINYCVDLPSLGIKYLNDKHIYSPIEIIYEKSISDIPHITRASYFEYSNINGALQNVFSTELSVPFLKSNFIQSFIGETGILNKDDHYVLNRKIVRFNATRQPNEILDRGSYAHAFLWDPRTSNLLAEISNARFEEVAYTSFDTEEKGNWSYASSLLDDATAPVGKRVYSFTGGSISKDGLSNSNTYKITYWSKDGSKTANGGTGTPGTISNGWQFFEHTILNPTDGLISISGTGMLDELRLFPENATMTTYGYDPYTGLTHLVDPNNVILYYNYDSFGRLSTIADMNKNITKRFEYNYRNQTLFGIYFNIQKMRGFTRDCPEGYEGSSVTYTVPKATYSSVESQSDADRQAEDDISTNGQSYANTHGECTSATEFHLNYSNFTTMTFTATYTNTTSGNVHTYTLNPSTYSDVPLDIIPRGVYNVSIFPSSGDELYDLSVYSHFVYGAGSLSATSVNFDCNCGHIEIDYH